MSAQKNRDKAFFWNGNVLKHRTLSVSASKRSVRMPELILHGVAASHTADIQAYQLTALESGTRWGWKGRLQACCPCALDPLICPLSAVSECIVSARSYSMDDSSFSFVHALLQGPGSDETGPNTARRQHQVACPSKDRGVIGFSEPRLHCDCPG